MAATEPFPSSAMEQKCCVNATEEKTSEQEEQKLKYTPIVTNQKKKK